MTISEARRILGLGPDEDPRPHLEEFRAARERIAAMVRAAPNDVLAERYQDGLMEFDKALAALREFLEASVPETPASDPALQPVEAPPEAAETPAATEAPAPEPEEAVQTAALASETPTASERRAFSWFVWLIVFLIGVAGGGFLYLKTEEVKETRRQQRLGFLERMGTEYVENRRWQEASEVYQEIERLAPGTELARLGRQRVADGMADERNQFVGYWTGQAIAELEAGRLDEAEGAIRRVIEKFPAEKESYGILDRIKAARLRQARDAALASARDLLQQGKPRDAAVVAGRLLATSPEDDDARRIIEEADALIAKQAADQARAMSLLKQAAARDKGEYDQQALDWLREAAALAPGNAEIAARLDKMASYTRTLKVPGDYATPAEALAVARDRDRIVLAEQTWKGPLQIDAAVDLEGAGAGKTIVECPATEGCAVTIGPDAKGARISGIAFRHASFLMTGKDRFSVALVKGGEAAFSDCTFTDASGHGLAVIEGGSASAVRCKFSGNGWNGAAASGKTSRLEVRESESMNNFEHGIESWDGAAVTLVNNRCEANSLNGIHTDNGSAAAVIEGNQLTDNREFGLVLDSAGSGKVSGNTARTNLLGGFVIRKGAAAVTVSGNQATQNFGPGIVLEKGLPAASYSENTATKNKGQEVVTDAELPN